MLKAVEQALNGTFTSEGKRVEDSLYDITCMMPSDSNKSIIRYHINELFYKGEVAIKAAVYGTPSLFDVAYTLNDCWIKRKILHHASALVMAIINED